MSDTYAPATGLGDLPQGLGPGASFIVPADPAQTGVADGQLVVKDELVFRLFGTFDEPTLTPAPISPVSAEVFPVAPLEDLGSPALAAALRSGQLAAVLEALAFDFVVVPVVEVDGRFEARSFPGAGGRADLQLFSSAACLAEFLGADPDRLFVIRHGAAVAEFVARRVDDLDNLVFDAGSEHPFTLPAGQLAAIVSAALDDEGEWEIEEAEPPPGEPVAFELPLTRHWAVLDLARQDVREQQIRELVKRQTRQLSDRGAGLRHDMRVWLKRTATQAQSAGGRQFAFLITQVQQAAAAVSLVNHWHDLGPGAHHLDQVARHLTSSAQTGDEIVRLRVEGDEVLRHRRVRSGSAEVGGAAIPLLLVDYWIAVPNSTSLAQVAVSSPHVPASDAIVAMTDTLVLGGRFVYPDEAGSGA